MTSFTIPLSALNLFGFGCSQFGNPCTFPANVEKIVLTSGPDNQVKSVEWITGEGNSRQDAGPLNCTLVTNKLSNALSYEIKFECKPAEVKKSSSSSITIEFKNKD